MSDYQLFSFFITFSAMLIWLIECIFTYVKCILCEIFYIFIVCPALVIVDMKFNESAN
jgi:hypothetical protein